MHASHWTRRRFLNAAATGAATLALPAMRGASDRKSPGDRSGRMVQTLSGPVSPDALGTMLAHEHVLYGPIPPELRERSVEIALGHLRDAARVGIDSLACLSPERDIRLYAQIAERSPVRIVVSTGSYVFPRSSPALQRMNEPQMFERMIRELTEGIDGTKLRAGIIKVAGAKSPLMDWERMAFRAAGRAQRETGVPVGTHAIYAPRDQFDLLVSAGADPQRCFFSHPEAKFGWQGRTLEQHADYLTAIAKEGGSLLFNNFGLVRDTPWPDLVFILRQLCDQGCADRVLISVDLAWEWIAGQPIVQHAAKYPEAQPRAYAYLITDAVPALLKAGFSARDIRTFLVDNPRRLFADTTP